MELRKTRQFTEWLDSLRDPMTRQRVAARLLRLSMGNAGDHRDLKEGVSEMRLDFGPGYRLYCTRRGNTIIVLLCGGDKGSQQKDIDLALKLAKELK